MSWAHRCTPNTTAMSSTASPGGLPNIRLHDTRGPVNPTLSVSGCPRLLRAGWLGHSIQVNRSAYLGKPKTKELAVISTALSGLLKADR